jgi:hypothetical protein
MCTWSLSEMYSLYTSFARTRFTLWRRERSSRKHSSNSSLNSFITESGFSAKTSICRWCDSDMAWHLNPFSSRHCFWHIWQYLGGGG